MDDTARESLSRSEALEYSRRLYANIIEWYKAAEMKAQVLLSLDGVFITIVVAFMLRESDATVAVVAAFGPETWATFIVAAVAMAISIVSAIMCLVSRVMPRSKIRARYGKVLDDVTRGNYPPEMMWFFQTISKLDEATYSREVARVNAAAELQALANQNYLLSRIVLRKLVAVNWGFASAAVALLALLVTGASYLSRVE